MNAKKLVILLQCCFIPMGALVAQSNTIAIFPEEDPLTPETHTLVWPTTPGVRYEVRQSTNLQSWTTVPGFPATANGPAQQMPFATDGNARFFRVRQLDEQPPVIVSQYPKDGGFAVPRFADITLQLSDVTGLDPASIQLTLSTRGTFTLANTNLTYTNNVVTFDTGGDTALGGWGSNVLATLIIADTLGNRVTNTWSFTLETQSQVATNLFVFGSPQAQRTGQRIGNIPTAALARRFGPIPMDDGDPWTLILVESNRLVLSYTNTAPGFVTNTYVCNLTPVRPGDIFNRKITAITDDPGGKQLTLFTVEVPLTEIVTNGAATISANSVILQTGTNGAFTKALEIGSTITFPRIGYSLDGTEFKLKDSVGDFDIVNLTLEEQHWWLTPRLQVSLEIDWGAVKRFEAIASGNVDAAAVWNVGFLLAGVALEKTIFELPEALQPKTWMVIGVIGVPPLAVPVYASLGLGVDLKARAEVHATLNFRAGLRQTMDAAFGLTYNQPNVQWVNIFRFAPPEVVPFTAKINAEGSLKLSLEPALEFLVYGLAGVSAGITPSGGLVFETGTDETNITFTLQPQSQTVQLGSSAYFSCSVTAQGLSGRLEADVSLDLGLAGTAFDLLNPKPELSLPLWHDQWPLFPDSETPGYQWYFNGVPLPGQTARTLLLPSVSYGHAGNYQVRATAGNQTSNSALATLTVVPAGVPSGMALIPAGSFTMGNCMDPSEDISGELPLHTAYVSAFYMDKYLVTKSLWDTVYQWAIAHGYTFDYAGSGKASTHPVQSIDWYDCVKWCNARSEKEGKTPAYYTDSGLSVRYRSGQVNVQTNWVNWSSGYRLPTEAEWEKAARGGASGQRFPWGNTIDWNDANYYGYPGSLGGDAYDNATAINYDPTFNDGVWPFTSPVGYFAANGYGLYDMAGNVWQWCWDWYGSYSSGSQTDPRGPALGSYRVARGGGWGSGAIGCRAAGRYGDGPAGCNGGIGFRSVLPPGQ